MESVPTFFFFFFFFISHVKHSAKAVKKSAVRRNVLISPFTFVDNSAAAQFNTKVKQGKHEIESNTFKNNLPFRRKTFFAAWKENLFK